MIVVGVLVALAGDGYRESLAERELEREYIDRMIRELAGDTASLSQTDIELRAKEPVLLRLTMLNRDSEIEPDELAQMLSEATTWTWDFTAPQSITFDELVSSGRIGVIADAELRAQIASYYSLYRSLNETIDARQPAFNSLTYRLVPRREPGAVAEGSDFDFQAGELSPAQSRGLMSAAASLAIREGATAELNFSRYSAYVARRLHGRASALLQRLMAGGR